MRGQSIVLSAYMATLVLVLALTVLFVSIYPRTSSMSFQYRQFDIVRLVYRKAYWRACDLADTIAAEYGADYVSVNITIYNLVEGRIVDNLYCIRTPEGITMEELVMYNYHFSILLGNGTMMIYDIEVGYK